MSLGRYALVAMSLALLGTCGVLLSQLLYTERTERIEELERLRGDLRQLASFVQQLGDQSADRLEELGSRLDRHVQATRAVGSLEGLLERMTRAEALSVHVARQTGVPMPLEPHQGPGCTYGRPRGSARVLVPFIYDPKLPQKLLNLTLGLARRLPPENPLLNVTLLLDDRPVPPFNLTGRRMPWTKVAHARNRVLRETDLAHYDYVAWIDADIVQYEPSILTSLVYGNPEGMSAPLVLIQSKSDEFYDMTAFITSEERAPPSVLLSPPYFPGTKPTQCVELLGVGAFFTVPVEVYKAGVLHDPHELRYTDHYPIARWVRTQGKAKCTCNKSLRTYHANLPKWGLPWHTIEKENATMTTG